MVNKRMVKEFSLGKRNRLPTVVVRDKVLESWLTLSEHTRSQLAGDLHVSKGRITQLMTSHEEPSAHLIAKLMLLTNLPFERLFKIVHSRSSLLSSSLAARTRAQSSKVV